MKLTTEVFVQKANLKHNNKYEYNIANKIYKIKSIIVQTGSATSGHYYSFIRNNNKWIIYFNFLNH